MSGHYDDQGRHICGCGEPTHYAAFSGGREFYCEACDDNGYYPEGDGGPRARLLDQGADGVAVLRAQMDQELARRADPSAQEETGNGS